ncbi:MAG TPA: sarcosine oxidase subunit beta family protein [Hyphomicrobiaceae bacterium]|nr:sarcosine oxidase subunit beta family protein [Hyphomicrobiaceae bacterium]
MPRYSIFALIGQGFARQTGWEPAWRKAEPKRAYDIVIVGGGGHGLATAHYLAKEHGLTNVAVIERGPIGLGNAGRNTTIVRSNYLLPENSRFYEKSMQLWEGLEADLGFNVMMSQRGVLNLFHTDGQRDAYARRGNAMRLEGIDAELLDTEGVRRFSPLIDVDNGRYPVMGGLLQPRGGTARHDAVNWGFARAASARGVDIVEHCEVTGFRRVGNRITGVETTKGFIAARKIGLAVAGHTTQVLAMAGLSAPIETHKLQAWVSEAIKPMIDGVITFGAGHFYISQSDHGGLVFGGGLDGYNSYAQRGTLPEAEHVMAAGISMIPALSRIRVLRQWAGIMDMSLDGSPFICKTPLEGLYLNAGWCYGGFKATPGSGWCFAHTIANDEPHALNAAFTLERFREGRLIDEKGAGPFAWAH